MSKHLVYLMVGDELVKSQYRNQSYLGRNADNIYMRANKQSNGVGSEIHEYIDGMIAITDISLHFGARNFQDQ